MPQKIVEQYRLVYRNLFMMPTLRAVPGETMRLPAFDESNGKGFRSSTIVVKFAHKHPKLWASNIVKEEDDGSWKAMICVNPELLEEPKAKQKTVLAHEWIEVFLAFRDRERPDN